MKVSIIIRGKNGHEYTEQCIRSIRENTPADSYTLIVVDDGSTPAYAFESDYRVRVDSCRGAVTATNLGLAIALQLANPYILVLDNDTEVPAGDTDWLSRFVGELECDPHLGAVGATTNFAKGAQHVLATPTTFTADWKDEHGRPVGSKANPLVAEFVSFAVLLRKAAVMQVGFWDEQYNPGNYEDTDYSVQLRVSGWGIKVARSVYIHHKGHRTFREDLGRLLQENGIKFVNKWGLGHLWDLQLVPDGAIKQALGRRVP